MQTIVRKIIIFLNMNTINFKAYLKTEVRFLMSRQKGLQKQDKSSLQTYKGCLNTKVNVKYTQQKSIKLKF